MGPILLPLGIGALFFLISRRSAKADGEGLRRTIRESTEPHIHGIPMQLSKNFRLREFMQSTLMPGMMDYKLTSTELDNLKKLASGVLQPIRDEYGPVTITSGIRPESMRGPGGETWFQLLTDAGYSPSRDSDHTHAAAAGIKLDNPDKYVPVVYKLAANPLVRQVILYYKTMASEEKVPSHIHVAVKHPRKPNRARRFAFVMVGKQDLGDIDLSSPGVPT